MEEKELLELGFINTSFTDEGITFTEHTSKLSKGLIQIDGLTSVDIFFDSEWINVPNCKTIDDLKHLIRLFI